MIKNKDYKPPKTILSPMAGITDVVLRSLVRRYSKNTLLTTEMLSSEALVNKPDVKISDISEDISPISCQIVGHKPNIMAKAAKILEKQNASVIDINMGCPVKKVVTSGDGSHLMLTLNLASEVLDAVVSEVKIPVSVKFRLGYSMEKENYIEFGKLMEKYGASFITLHARYRNQMYSGKSDWKKIALLVKEVNIPVFANGDICSPVDAKTCMDITKAYGVSIGRGVLISDVSLISRVEKYLNDGILENEMNFIEKIEILKEYINMECNFRGEENGIKFMRKFYPYFISSIKNASNIRQRLMLETTKYGVFDIISELKNYYKIN